MENNNLYELNRILAQTIPENVRAAILAAIATVATGKKRTKRQADLIEAIYTELLAAHHTCAIDKTKTIPELIMAIEGNKPEYTQSSTQKYSAMLTKLYDMGLINKSSRKELSKNYEQRHGYISMRLSEDTLKKLVAMNAASYTGPITNGIDSNIGTAYTVSLKDLIELTGDDFITFYPETVKRTTYYSV